MSNSPDDQKKDASLSKAKAPSSIPTPKSKRGVKGFFADTSREMKKVNWPTKKETTRLTFVVLSLVVAGAIMLSLMGWVSETFVTLVTNAKESI